MSYKAARKAGYAQRAAKISEIIDKYGVEDRDRLARALLHFCPDLTFEEREIIVRTGKPPVWIEKAKSARTGFYVRIKQELILAEWWYAGKKQPDMKIEIAIAQWPTRPTGMAANVAYEQRQLVMSKLTAMFTAVGVDMTDVEVLSDVTRRADNVILAINKKLPAPQPNSLRGASDSGVESYIICDLGEELVAMPLWYADQIMAELVVGT